LYFSTVEEYAAYANSVVNYEKGRMLRERPNHVAIFATEHPFDPASQALIRGIVRPFVDGVGTQKRLGQRQHFLLHTVLSDEATKGGFARLLRGENEGGPPALLFSGTHGMVFRSDDKRQADCQGALVCQDWEGLGLIDEDHWFSSADLASDACIHGMIYFLFACYGGGWEKFDTFRTDLNGPSRQIALRPAFSKLPLAMLAHPKGGALAVIAHIDRAWTYSFETAKGGAQSTGMREVLECIMMGRRVGNATDRFNIRWVALSAPLADALRDFEKGDISSAELARRWIPRDDARNYIILGDPAVRLRVNAKLETGLHGRKKRPARFWKPADNLQF
jgi:hypothetical protein